MNLDQMTIGEFKELSKLFNGTKEISKQSLGKNIVVLQRGWVVVGDLYKKGEQYFLENSSIIRNWGTSKGIGEIAKNGPTDKTILDPTPEINFHELTTILIIKCEESKWVK